MLFSAENVHILVVNFFSAHANKVRRDLRQVPRDGRADQRGVEARVLRGDDRIGEDHAINAAAPPAAQVLPQRLRLADPLVGASQNILYQRGSFRSAAAHFSGADTIRADG